MFSRTPEDVVAPVKKSMSTQQIKETELSLAKMGMIISLGGLILGVLNMMRKR